MANTPKSRSANNTEFVGNLGKIGLVKATSLVVSRPYLDPTSGRIAQPLSSS